MTIPTEPTVNYDRPARADAQAAGAAQKDRRPRTDTDTQPGCRAGLK